MNLNFVEMRKRIIQYMSLRYGVMRVEMLITSTLQARLKTASISAMRARGLSAQSTITGRAAYYPATHIKFTLALHFADSASAKTAGVTFLIPGEIKAFGQATAKAAKTLFTTKLFANDIEIQFDGAASLVTTKITEFCSVDEVLNSQLSAMLKAAAAEIVEADIKVELTGQIKLSALKAWIVKATVGTLLAVIINVLSPDCNFVESDVVIESEASVNMYAVKIARLFDYNEYPISSMTDKLSELEYIKL